MMKKFYGTLLILVLCGLFVCAGMETAYAAFTSLTVGGVDALTTSSGTNWSYNANTSTLTITGNIGAVKASTEANSQDVLNITVTNNATVDGGIYAGGKLNLVVNSGVTLTVNSSGDSHAIASGYHGVQDSIKITGGGTVVAISNGNGDGIKSGGGLWIEGVTIAAQGRVYGLDSGSGRLYIKDNSKVYAVSSQGTAIVAPSSAGHDVVEISGENTVVVAGFALGSAANNYVPTIDTPSNSSIRTGTLKVNCGHLIVGDGFSVSSFDTGSMVLVSHSNYAEYVGHLTNYQQNSDGTHTPKCINGCPVPTSGTVEACSGTTYCNGTVCDKCGQTSGTGDGTSHKEGTAATCTTLAVCEICTQTYGELDPTNHTGSATGNYTYVDGTYHSAIFTCCQTTDNAREEHTPSNEDNLTCGVCGGLMLDKVLAEIAAAPSGTTLTYSGTLGTEANPDSTSQVIMTIPEGVTVNWDVDAVVNMSPDGNIRYYPLSLSGGGTLNLTGSIKNQGSSPSVTLTSGSTVTLVVKNGSVVECASGTAIAVYGGKLIVEGGTVSGASTYESSAIALNNAADVTITGGTVTAGYYVIHHSGSGKVAVSGDAQIIGTYADDNWGAGIRIENAGTAEVSGSPTIKHTNGRGIFAGDDDAIIIFRAGTTAIVTGEVYGIYNGHVAYEIGANPTITGNTANTSSITTCSGGTTTCKSGPVCTTCGTTYDEADADAHTGGTTTCASGPVCTECGITYGQPDATRHVWDYTASGATITAACTNAGCGANGGSFTLQAPASLVYDGSEKVVSVEGAIDGVTVAVEYTGDRKNVTTDGFSASVTLGNATATISGMKITPAPVTITGLAATDRAYDGTVNVTLTDGSLVGLKGSDQVTIDLSSAQAVMADANAGENKAVTVTGVELTGDAAGNYELKEQPTGLTVTITKAEVTPVSGAIQVTNDLAANYTFDLANLLPVLDGGKTYGNVSYTLEGVTFTESGYYTNGAAINGSTLTLPIAAVQSSTEEQIGTITISITSTNYAFSQQATITVSSVNKLLPTGAPTLTPASITYGQPLSAITLSGSMQDESGNTVSGTFTWDAPDSVYDAGTQQAAWTFTPNDTNTYLQATGTSSITVNKANGIVTTAPKPNTLTYDGTQQALVTAGAATGGEMQYSLDGVNYSATIPMGIDAGQYTVWYKVVGDQNHNDSTPQSIPVTINKMATEFGSFGVFNGENQTTTFTYGDTITVKAAPQRATTFSLLRAFEAPDNNQMALFIGDTQITAPVDAVGGVYTMTYETSGKALPVGKTTITAKYVGNDNLLGYEQSADITLKPKQLTIASVSAKDRIYNSDTFTVQITGATFTGKVLETDDVTLTENTLGTLAGDAVGTYTEVTLPDPTKLTGKHASYYTVTGGAKVSTNVQITEVPEDLLVKTEINENFSDADIPAELKVKFDTVAKIETELRTQITKQDSGVLGTELYDVVLMYSEDGGQTWIKADKEHFPKNGRLPVMLPIPEGTNPDSHDYIVTHMFTSSAFGKTPGDVEMPPVSIAYDAQGRTKIYVEVTGLSPIMVGWTEKETTVNLPQTGDDSNIHLWFALMVVSMASMVGVVLTGKKRREN